MKRMMYLNLVLMIAIALTACGGNGDRNGSPSPSPTSAAATAAPSQNADSKPATNAAATRIVQHSKGEKEIPANPQKIAVINVVAFEDNLLALGVKPYAAPVFAWSKSKFLPYLAEELQGSEGIDGAEPNLEALVALEPDLIIIEARHEKVYDQLDKIAPTVIVSSDPDWRVRLLHLADIVNRKEQAEQILQTYDENQSQTKEQIKSSIGQETVILAILQDETTIRVQGMIGHAVNEMFYNDLGLTPAEGVPADEMRMEVSLEGFIKLDPDHIFLQKNREQSAEEMLSLLKDNDVLRNMKAIKNNHIYIIEDMLTKSWGIKGRQLILDQTKEALAN